MLLAIVLLAALGSAQPSRPAPRLGLLVIGAPDADTRRGIELGVAETAQTVRLLGGDVTVVEQAQSGADRLAGVIVATGATEGVAAGVPRIHLGPLPDSAGACSFSVSAAEAGDTGAVLWHPSLNRFGASELNERFVKQYRSGMTERAYAGWIAVKALVEAALRVRNADDRCAAVARLRFDGHKGRPLSFDPGTRVLRQPLYVLENGRVVGEKE